MKKIPLKIEIIKIQKSDGNFVETDFDYKKNIIGALNQSPIDERSGQPTGFTPIEMRNRLKLIDLFEKQTKDFILLENSDYLIIKKCVEQQKWQILDVVIMNFIDDVLNAKDEEVN